jgi:hypothetical protein
MWQVFPQPSGPLRLKLRRSLLRRSVIEFQRSASGPEQPMRIDDEFPRSAPIEIGVTLRCLI